MRRSPKRVYMWVALNLFAACVVAIVMVEVDSRRIYTLDWPGWYVMVGLILMFLFGTLILLVTNRDIFRQEAQKQVIKRFNRRLYDIERSPESINRIMRARTYEFEFKEDRLAFTRGVEPNVETFVVMTADIVKVTVRRMILGNRPVFTLLVRYLDKKDENVLSLPLIPDFYHLFKEKGIFIENDSFLDPDSVFKEPHPDRQTFRFTRRIVFYKLLISVLVVIIMGSLASVIGRLNEVPYVIVTVLILVPMWFESRSGGRLTMSPEGVTIIRRLGVDATWDDILEVTIDEERHRISFLTYAGPFQFRYHPDMKSWIEMYHTDKMMPERPENIGKDSSHPSSEEATENT
jgi:hypothetical protein